MTKTLRRSTPKSANKAYQSTNIDRSIPPDVDAELTPKTRAFVHHLFDRIEELTKRVERLEAILAAKATPWNSSLPPSTVHPHAKPISKKPKSSRKQGGRPGHQRQTQPLIPTLQIVTAFRTFVHEYSI